MSVGGLTWWRVIGMQRERERGEADCMGWGSRWSSFLRCRSGLSATRSLCTGVWICAPRETVWGSERASEATGERGVCVGMCASMCEGFDWTASEQRGSKEQQRVWNKVPELDSPGSNGRIRGEECPAWTVSVCVMCVRTDVGTLTLRQRKTSSISVLGVRSLLSLQPPLLCVRGHVVLFSGETQLFFHL